MEIERPCVTCGKEHVCIDNLDLGNTKNWFVKCENCISVTTITHAVRDEAIRQWNNQWCWQELDIAKKLLESANARVYKVLQSQTEDTEILKFRYEKMTDEYIKYRMLYSGTAGNMNLEERKNLMKKEISTELGWTI